LERAREGKGTVGEGKELRGRKGRSEGNRIEGQGVRVIGFKGEDASGCFSLIFVNVTSRYFIL